MPDWSYQTLFRPVLFRLPARKARDITLKSFGLFGRLPFGSFVIKTMGHMENSPILKDTIGNTPIPYPVGLSGILDIHGEATKALSQIGFGFIEIGPVTLRAIKCNQPIIRNEDEESILYPQPYFNDGFEKVLGRMKTIQFIKVPIFFRLRHMNGCTPEEALTEINTMMRGFSQSAGGFYFDCLDENWSLHENILHIQNLIKTARTIDHMKPILLYIPLDYSLDNLQHLTVLSEHLDGFVIGDCIQTEQGFEVGKHTETSVEKIAVIRQSLDIKKSLIVTDGVHEPQDALDLLKAGANYIQLHSGLVYSGPGLPKRINEAIQFEKMKGQNESLPHPSFWKYWGWTCLLGIGMIIGGIMAWIIAATTVLLPYEEAFIGLSTAELDQMNERLIPFMSHDRITLAGTMIAIGILYFMLGWFGLKHQLHWAKTALVTSGIVGFSSIFLFIGYGYFDPLHALAALLLFPLFILAMFTKGNQTLYGQPNLRNDRSWYLAQWGQFFLVILGFSLLIGGLVISYVGITNVFVPHDLAYLQTSSDVLNEKNSRIIPLIAHDRAGFGGTLICLAIGILTSALWGIQEGKQWIWWMFLFSGTSGFIAGYGVHWDIGYRDFFHLLPAFFVSVMHLLGLIFLYPYLMKRRTSNK